jgi:hypothetical protein
MKIVESAQIYIVSLFAALKRHLFTLGACLSVTLALSACGSGDIQAPANTKIELQISNLTSTDFATISITDRANAKEVYNDEFICAASTRHCMVFYTGLSIQGSAVLEFKDRTGVVVAYYDTANTPGVYLAVNVDDFTTGAYLYEQLVTTNDALKVMSIGDFAYRFELFTANYPSLSTDDLYQQLTAHYRFRQSTQPGTSIEFVTRLGQRLENGVIAEQNEFIVNNIPLLAKASGSPGGCPSAFVYLFSLAGDVLGDSFSKALKPYFKQIGKIGGDACKPGGNGKLGEILNALNNLQSSVDNIQNNLGALSNFVAKVKLEEKLKAYDRTTKDLIALSENYKNLLRLNQVNSLKDYVSKNYGAGSTALDSALANDSFGGVLTTIIEVAGGNRSGGFLKDIDALTAGDITLIDGLNLLCANPSIGNLVEQRSLCNMVISSTIARLAAAHDIALILTNEGYEVFDAYPTTARRYGYDVSKGASQYKQSLIDIFYTQKNSLANSYQNIVNSDGSKGYFRLLDGLSTTLLANLKNVNCYDVDDKSLLVSGWIKEASNEYLITNCNAQVDGRLMFYIPVQARYFLKVDNQVVSNTDSVANIMGVLIPLGNKDPLKAGLPHTNRLVVKLIAMRDSYGPQPGTFISNGFGLRGSTPNIVNSNIFDGAPERLKPYLNPWNNSLLTANGLSLYSHEGFVSEGLFNLIRYTDKNAISYVFTLSTAGDRVALWCMTADCSANMFTETLSFKYGMKDLTLRQADSNFDRALYGWQIDGQFIDAK